MGMPVMSDAGEIGAGFNHVRDRIVTAPCKRAAAAQPLQREQDTAPGAMTLDGLVGIIRARRVILAGASQERREEDFIDPKECQQNPTSHRCSTGP
jgi:hypothetical protein